MWSPQGDDIYIGSTVQSLSVRKAEHKRKSIYESCSSKILFEKYDDVRIELIEEFPCKNKQQLNKREGHYIRTLVCVNKQIAGRTPKEWSKQYREANKEKIQEQRKERYEKNKEKENERNRRYHEENKDEINERRRELYENNKEKIKEYNEKNKEKINQLRRERYENNREKINQKQRERYAMKKNLVSVQSPVLSPEHSVE